MVTIALHPFEGFTFGCDPERFVCDPNGKPVSAAGMFPGTKEEPFPVPDGAIQVDGMAAEFNITPAETFAEFNRSISSVMRTMETYLPEGYTFLDVSAVRFGEENFNNAPEEAKQLGCTPDFNAWTGEMNPPPVAPDDPFLRTASGHIHFGWRAGGDIDAEHIQHCRDFIKQLDWFAGAWTVKMDPDPTRRKLYGRAGAMRPKEYGVEWRVPSNFWITTRDRRLTMWNRCQMAIFQMRKHYMPDRAEDWNDVLVQSINDTTLDAGLLSAYRYPILTNDAYYARF